MLWNPCSLRVYGNWPLLLGESTFQEAFSFWFIAFFQCFSGKFSSVLILPCVLQWQTPQGPAWHTEWVCVALSPQFFGQSLNPPQSCSSSESSVCLAEGCLPTGDTSNLAQGVWCCAQELTGLQVKGNCCRRLIHPRAAAACCAMVIAAIPGFFGFA